MTFLSVFSVIADLDGLALIVASLASPASETATTALGGTIHLTAWKVQNRRRQFAFPAALMSTIEPGTTDADGMFSLRIQGITFVPGRSEKAAPVPLSSGLSGALLVTCCRTTRAGEDDETKD
jgi:hypothetical protein